jgi:hypothetical protein
MAQLGVTVLKALKKEAINTKKSIAYHKYHSLIPVLLFYAVMKVLSLTSSPAVIL